MIELLFVLCVPVIFAGQTVDYDCSWSIVFVEFQGMMTYLYEFHSDFQKTWEPDNRRLLGLTVHNVKTIYLWNGHEGQKTITGCTVLWHEILHSRGVSEEEMPLTVKGKCIV